MNLVLDSLKTHKNGRWCTTGWSSILCFHLHFTPTSASWLNLLECWFSVLSRHRLERGAFTSTEDLEGSDPRLHRRHECSPQAVRLDQVR